MDIPTFKHSRSFRARLAILLRSLVQEVMTVKRTLIFVVAYCKVWNINFEAKHSSLDNFNARVGSS